MWRELDNLILSIISFHHYHSVQLHPSP